jgi:hypothetical protein
MDQLGDEESSQPTGLNPLDMAELPDEQRQVMFAMLRDNRAKADGLTVEMLREKFDEVERLDEILTELTHHSWLIRLGEGSNVRYKVNLRRRRGSKLGGGLWASLSSRLDDDAGESPPKAKPDLPSTSDW